MTVNDHTQLCELHHAIALATFSSVSAARIATANGIRFDLPSLTDTLQMFSTQNNFIGFDAAIASLKVVLSPLQKALSKTAVHGVTDLFELSIFVSTLQLVLKRARALPKSTKVPTILPDLTTQTTKTV